MTNIEWRIKKGNNSIGATPHAFDEGSNRSVCNLWRVPRRKDTQKTSSQIRCGACLRCIEAREIPKKKLVEWVDEEIAKIIGDERYGYAPAKLDVNGYLAIIQIEMKSRLQVLMESRLQVLQEVKKRLR